MTGIAELAAARIRRRRVLGGLINEYEGRCGHRRPVAKSQLKGHDARSSHPPVRDAQERVGECDGNEHAGVEHCRVARHDYEALSGRAARLRAFFRAAA
jgi:hypothetical protein